MQMYGAPTICQALYTRDTNSERNSQQNPGLHGAYILVWKNKTSKVYRMLIIISAKKWEEAGKEAAQSD